MKRINLSDLLSNSGTRKRIEGIIIGCLLGAVLTMSLNKRDESKGPVNCDTREEITERYEMIFGAPVTDERAAVEEYIFLGEGMDEALMIDLEKHMFNETKHID